MNKYLRSLSYVGANKTHYKIRTTTVSAKIVEFVMFKYTISDGIWLFPSMSCTERSSDIEIILVSVQGFTCVYWRVSLTRTPTLTRINLNVDKVGTNSVFNLYFSEPRTAFSSLQFNVRHAHSEVRRTVPIVMRVSLTLQ